MKKLIFTLFIQMLCLALFGAPAKPTPRTHTQSDGTQLTVRLRGDEYLHWQETADGYTLFREANGDFSYACLNAAEDLVSSNVLAHNPDQRTASETAYLQHIQTKSILQSQSAKKRTEQSRMRRAKRAKQLAAAGPQTTGIRKQLIILVEFEDVQFRSSYDGTALKTVPLFNEMANGANYTENGAKGSIQQYYQDNSNGKLKLDFTVMGPVRLSRPSSYYGAGEDENAPQMVIDALTILEADGVDFTPYANASGEVESVYVIYAGFGEEQSEYCPDCIWAHQWELVDGYGSMDFGGVTFDVYSCSSELTGETDQPTSIGVICHEFGHALGLMDLYDTEYAAKGLGPWSLMGEGNWNAEGHQPPYFTGYERYLLGWTTFDLLPSNNVTLTPTGDSCIAYYFYAKNADGTDKTNEFFLVENRNATSSGKWDAGIRISDTYNEEPKDIQGGLMVYHIDRSNMTLWNDNEINIDKSHENFKILSANSITIPDIYQSLAYWDFCSDAFPQGSKDSITDNSTPNTKSWGGIASNVSIKNITKSGVAVQFTVDKKDCQSTLAQIDTTIFEGDSIFFNGQWIKEEDGYLDTIVNSAGCDSIILLDVTVVPPATAIAPTLKDEAETLKTTPNPVKAGEVFTILLPDYSDNSTIRIEIYNLLGEMILSEAAQGTEVQIAGLSRPGTYILRVSNQSALLKSTKIIVVH
ncbi:MAG: M6 family metalloprotease domain-containing protein [Bacteroidales bacterium]|jgi:M6 family metalloprotease-like protein|nr:M6 family metalloprotease domain-containing protein [Bacteroidales bacterium]